MATKELVEENKMDQVKALLKELLPHMDNSALSYDDVDFIYNGIKDLTEELRASRAMRRAYEGHAAEILDIVVALANLDYSRKASVERDGTVLDALAGGINMLGEELKESTVSRDYFENILFSMTEMLVVVDSNTVIQKVNTALIQALGYSREELLGKDLSFIFSGKSGLNNKPNKKKLAERGYLKEYERVLKRKDGKKISVLCSASLLKKGDANSGIVCVIQDVTNAKRAEDKIKASLKEKEVLIKEIHHRVKNNLQVISSLLSLQSAYIEDEASLQKFRESQERVKSMALIHEKLYNTETLSEIDFGEYLRELAASLYYTYKVEENKVKFNIEVEDRVLDIDTAVPCALIVNELLSNAFKYAFPNGRKGRIDLTFKGKGKKAKGHELIICDNGVGFPEGLDFKQTDTLGMQLVTTLVEQLRGKVELDASQGTQFTIRF